MNKFLIASCLLALAFGWSVSASKSCSCTQYAYQNDCQTAGCSWNANNWSCGNWNCTALTVTNCAATQGCYWNTTSTTCNTFSSCSSLNFNTQALCQAAKGPGTGTGACVLNNSTNTTCIADVCSLYTTANCPANCQTTTTACVAYTQCSQFTTSALCPTSNACSWNGASCISSVCTNLTATNQTCTYVASSLNPSSLSITPCILNGTTNCIDASGSSALNNYTWCYSNTAGLFHWSSNLTTDGSCVACYGVMVQIVFAIILLLA